MTSLQSLHVKNSVMKYGKYTSDQQHQSIRCTVPSCSCDCFVPNKMKIRNCDSCRHGWVAHAVDKLGLRHMYNCGPVEVVQSNTVFDIASLMLFGTTATPIRLKILLDRLFSVLQHDQVLNVLNGFGWTYEDYARGYILQDKSGNVLDKWSMPTREEEAIILQQFLRFGETKSITQQILMQENSEQRVDYSLNSPTKAESDIKKFIERANYAAVTALSNVRNNQQEKSLQRLPSNASSSQNLSPTSSSGSFGSPIICTSPSLSASPLNKLQSMHPYDYRKARLSPSELPQSSSSISVQPKYSTSSPITTMPPQMSFMNSNQMKAMAPSLLSVSVNNNSVEYSTPELGSDDDSIGGNSCGPLNLTTAAGPIGINQSIYASRKVRHLRKSANPMRRRWNSSSMSAFSMNPTPGKKRVQCHVCMKTFCDKGALKIHYSAVHLREMHKCTVEGCNMMFSSRRSRNRHSANPNPKLHTPNCRRKISPHDGRVANPLPLIPPSMSYNPSMVSPMYPESGKINEVDQALMMSGKSQRDDCISDLPPLYQIAENNNIVDGAEDLRCDKAVPLTMKRPCCDSEEGDSHVSNGEDKSTSAPYRNEHTSLNSTRGVRKRKSLNPTRCAINDHHRLAYTSTDDSSSEEDGGVAFRQDELDDSSDNNILSDSESDSVNIEGLGRPVPPGNLERMEVEESPEKEMRQDTNQRMEDAKEEMENDEDSRQLMNEEDIKTEVSDDKDPVDRSEEREHIPAKITPSQCDESSENALRQLETLSQSTFCDFLNSATTRLMGNPHLVPGSMGFFPTNPNNLFSDPSKSNPSSSSSSTLPPSGEHGSPGCRESLMLQGQIPTFPDNSLLGGMDIPVDKDNPRRCIACGKIFQNHFGVKTHYQNVHLKLMHKCTVEGCNAAFPSKRSRDRHSANLNLHRKLLSTSSDPGSKLTTNFIDKSSGGLTPPSPFGTLPPPPPPSSHHQNIREELFSRLYDPHNLSAALSFAEFYHGGKLPTSAAAEALLTNGDRGLGFFNHPLLPGFPPFLPAAAASAAVAALNQDFAQQNMCLERDRETPPSLNSSPSPPPVPSKSPSLIINNNNNNNDNESSKHSNNSTCGDSGDETPSRRAKAQTVASATI